MELLLNKDFLKFYNQDIFAKTAVSVLYDMSLLDDKKVFQKLFETKNTLFKQYSNNIVVKNSLNYFLFNFPAIKIKDHAKGKKNEIIKKINLKNTNVAKIGAKKIKPNSTIFVHSLNNQLIGILKTATKYKKFQINVLKHDPYNFGQLLSEKLSSVKVFPDLAIKQAVENADVCFIGADSILKEGAIAKQGSYLAAEIAIKHHTPVYICAHSWKYDNDKTSLTFLQEHSEHIPAKIISAFISEYGIFKPEFITKEIKFHNKELFI